MNCPFCKEIERPESFKEDVLPSWPHSDRIILRNGGAVLFPGLGPVVPNTPYALAVPRSCVTSFLDASQEERESLFDLIDRILEVEELFPNGRALVFEHGGTSEKPGCQCINHCHIHIMNNVGDWARLPERIDDHHQSVAWVTTTTTPALSTPYLFAGRYEKGSGRFEGRMATIQGCRQTQFFRALLGEMTGNLFDYRKMMNQATMEMIYRVATRSLSAGL